MVSSLIPTYTFFSYSQQASSLVASQHTPPYTQKFLTRLWMRKLFSVLLILVSKIFHPPTPLPHFLPLLPPPFVPPFIYRLVITRRLHSLTNSFFSSTNLASFGSGFSCHNQPKKRKEKIILRYLP